MEDWKIAPKNVEIVGKKLSDNNNDLKFNIWSTSHTPKKKRETSVRMHAHVNKYVLPRTTHE